jgi:putative SOS response-associated peptidase YedK
MCGRYTLTTTAELVEEVFAVDARDLAPRWNIAPTEPAPVVRSANGGRRLDLLRWGLVPAGSEGPAGGPLHINARSETVDTLPAFRDSFASRRCLVPADGFYEWTGDGRQRRAQHIRFADRRLFAFAGLWSAWHGEGGELESFTILTCPPSELVASVHDRMPAILPPAAWEPWLLAEEPASLLRWLQPWSEGGMETATVGPYVNRAGNEGPECLLPPPPVSPPPQRTLFP